jgi:hypothetical protein
VRKLWCAGAIASGFLLLGAAPAQAEPLPTPGVAEAPLNALGYALEPTNGWRVGTPLASDPLSGQPLVDIEPGGGRKLLQVEPGADAARTARRPAPEQSRTARKSADRRPLKPAADVISGTRPGSGEPTGALGGVPVSGVPMPLAGQDFTVADTPVDGLFGALPLIGGLSPAGMATTPGTRAPSGDERPVARTEAASEEFPVLGGPNGATTVVDNIQFQVVDLKSDVAGLPIGGTSVMPAGRSALPDAVAPAAGQPAASPSTLPATGSAAPGTTTPSTTTPGASTPSTTTSGTTTPSNSASGSPAPAKSPGAKPATSASPRQSSTLPATEAEDPRLYEEPVDGFVGK